MDKQTTLAPPSTPAIPTESPYIVQENLNERVTASGAWRVELFSGCCDDFSSCLLPTFAPCLAIEEVAQLFLKRSTAMWLGLLFGVFFVCILAVNTVYFFVDLSTTISADFVCHTDAWWCFLVEIVTLSMRYNLLAIPILYRLSLWAFRSVFRRYLKLPGDSLTDFLSTFFCSCCALAQMHTHVKRSKREVAVDTLPAYRAA